jgi:hypothetical protein
VVRQAAGAREEVNALFEAARELQLVLDGRGWRFCLIGGLALLRWGQPRLTRDVDVSLLCPFGDEDRFTLPIIDAGFLPRLADAAAFARQSRVLLVASPKGIPIDIALAALPFEEGVIDRSSLFEFEPGCALRTCSAEDLVILKLFALRPQDVLDAETVADRHGRALDWEHIEANLTPLAEIKDEPEILKALERLRRRT